MGFDIRHPRQNRQASTRFNENISSLTRLFWRDQIALMPYFTLNKLFKNDFLQNSCEKPNDRDGRFSKTWFF
jgi:hypothetical protein